MEHVATVIARWWTGRTPEHVDAVERMRTLGLIAQRCCPECPFESLSPRRMVLHRVNCERFDIHVLSVLAGNLGDQG